MRIWLLASLLAASTWIAAPHVQAQQNTQLSAGSILIIESDELFQNSKFGQRVFQEQEARKAVLLAENRQIASELAEEEMQLTEQRKTLATDDFRKLADAFDLRVEEIRSIQDAKEQDIIRFIEDERIRFFQEIVPILNRILQERGAALVLEKRMTFASSKSLNVTPQALAMADSLMGDGAIAEDEGPLETPQETAPETVKEQ